MAELCWWYYISKLSEFLDTVSSKDSVICYHFQFFFINPPAWDMLQFALLHVLHDLFLFIIILAKNLKLEKKLVRQIYKRSEWLYWVTLQQKLTWFLCPCSCSLWCARRTIRSRCCMCTTTRWPPSWRGCWSGSSQVTFGFYLKIVCQVRDIWTFLNLKTCVTLIVLIS